MRHDEFQKLTFQLQSGNEIILDKLLFEHLNPSVSWFIQKFKVSKCIAEDFFMDALWKLRTKLLAKAVQNENIGAYLRTTMRNDYLKFKLRSNRNPIIQMNENWLDALLFADQKFEFFSEKKQKIAQLEKEYHSFQALTIGLSKLERPCRQLLEKHYLEGMTLKELAGTLGYASANSLSHKKRNCLEKLRVLIEETVECFNQDTVFK